MNRSSVPAVTYTRYALLVSLAIYNIGMVELGMEVYHFVGCSTDSRSSFL